MREVKAEIEIEAPAEEVWKVLNDFQSYPEWNPFITALVGENKLGSVLRATAKLPGRRDMHFKTQLASVNEPSHLLMKSVYVPGLLRGQHAFFIEQLDMNRTRFSQSDVFAGILRPLAGSIIHDVQKSMVQMNEAIKKRCEVIKKK